MVSVLTRPFRRIYTLVSLDFEPMNLVQMQNDVGVRNVEIHFCIKMAAIESPR